MCRGDANIDIYTTICEHILCKFCPPPPLFHQPVWSPCNLINTFMFLTLGESIYWRKHPQEVPNLCRKRLPGPWWAGGLHRQGDYPWLPGRRVYGEWRIKHECQRTWCNSKIAFTDLFSSHVISLWLSLYSVRYLREAWSQSRCTALQRSLRMKMFVCGPKQSTKAPASSKELHMRWDWVTYAEQQDKSSDTCSRYVGQYKSNRPCLWDFVLLKGLTSSGQNL